MIHDVVSGRFPDEAAPPRSAMVEARSARAGVCPSLFSADEVAKVPGVRDPIAIPNGVGLETFDAMRFLEAELAQPEICGDAALLVDPSAGSLAEGVLHAPQGGAAIEHLVAPGQVLARAYTWDRSAAAHAEVWPRVVAS